MYKEMLTVMTLIFIKFTRYKFLFFKKKEKKIKKTFP